MKSPLSLIVIIFISLSFLSCDKTDVPLGYDSKLPDKRLVGLWWYTDENNPSDQIYDIQDLGGSATVKTYSYDVKKGKFDINNKTGFPLFKSFTTQTGEVNNFVSVKVNDSFLTVLYKFLSNSQLETAEINFRSIPGAYLQEKDDYFKFGTTLKYQRYVQANVDNPDLYREPNILQRISSISNLESKLREKYKRLLAKSSNPSSITTPKPQPDQKVYSLDELMLIGTVALGAMDSKKGSQLEKETIQKRLLSEKGFKPWFSESNMYGFKYGDDYSLTVGTDFHNIRIAVFNIKLAKYYLLEIQKYYGTTSIRPLHEGYTVLRSHTKPFILETLLIDTPFRFEFIYEEPFRYPSLK